MGYNVYVRLTVEPAALTVDKAANAILLRLILFVQTFGSAENDL